jgi:Flp pilus assembly protein TadD
LDKAILLFQRSLEKDSRFAPAHAGLAEAFVRKFSETKDSSWLQKARQECGRALSLNENLALAYLTQGRIDFFAGNFNGAIQSLEKAVALSPGNEEAQNNLAMVYDRAGQLLRAESLLKEVLRRNRANWVTYDFLAAFYYRHQQYNQAELLFRTAMDLAPDNSVAFSNLAAIYMSEGRCAEAESLLIHAVGALPNPGAGAWSNLGTAKFCIEKYGESAALFRKAIQLRPADHRLWRNLGDALTRAGDTTGARDAYRTAVEMAQRVLAVDPQDGVLLGNIALYYAKLGEPEKASRSLAKAQRFQAQNQDFVLLTAEVFEAMGKRERAIAVIRGLLQKGYSQDEIRNDFEFAQLRKDPRYAAMVADRGSASKLAAE